MFINVEGYDSWSEVLGLKGRIDYLVVIPSRNSSATITYVIDNVYKGLMELDGEGLITVIDGLSSDPTRRIVSVLKDHYSDVKLYILPNTLSPGKGGAMNLGVKLGYILGVKALAFIDSDLRSISPEWPVLLIKGALEKGFVAPNYVRDRYDATITNFVARPLTTTAYMIDLHQPIGGEFGLGKKLIEYLANEAPWNSIEYNLLFGTDIFITHTALSQGIEPCEAVLGSKIHEAKDPGVKLYGMFIEVLGSLYNALIEYVDSWRGINREKIVVPEKIEEPKPPYIPPPQVRIDKDKAFNEYSKIIEEKRNLMELFFGDEVLSIIEESIRRGEGLSNEYWPWILLQGFRVFVEKPRYSTRRMLLDLMYHLWQGRLYEYYVKVKDMSDREVMEEIDAETYRLVEHRDILLSIVEKL